VASGAEVRKDARRMIRRLRRDLLSSPTFVLVAGRTIGLVLAFAIPVVLARIFDRAEFGTYKQLFLIYGTLYGLAQVGMAESLYFFVPGQGSRAGRHVANALLTLALAALAVVSLLYLARGAIADGLTNPDLAAYLPLVGAFLGFTLVSAAFEIVMVSRKEHLPAAFVYAGSDLLRTAMIVGPAIALWGLRGVLIGAATFAAIRMTVMLGYLFREFGRDLRLDLTLWRSQLVYAVPFALAVGVEVIQANLHQYLVASRFDAATFAIYAVGCLQIPLVDLICTSTANVMMVRMAEEAGQGHKRDALALWHNTTCRLAFIIFPLAAFLLVAGRGIIVTLFTADYLASVPIFRIWCLMILPATFTVDAVLRVHARTRFLLVMNLVRLSVIVLLIGPFVSAFGLAGAVLITLAATMIVRAAGIIKIARVMNVGLAEVQPWRRLAGIALQSAVAAVPAFWVSQIAPWPPFVVVAATAAVYAAAYGGLWYMAGLKTCTTAGLKTSTTAGLNPGTTAALKTGLTANSPKEIPSCAASQAS
jgi:O-antigen/teichoic acid export membrane protein